MPLLTTTFPVTRSCWLDLISLTRDLCHAIILSYAIVKALGDVDSVLSWDKMYPNFSCCYRYRSVDFGRIVSFSFMATNILDSIAW
eukprot:g63246.t1